MTPTICRSFWGNGQTSFFKAERDIISALNCRRPHGTVYSYGPQASYFLGLCGIEHHRISDKMPDAYRGGKDPPASMWWHKLIAIRQCLLDTQGPVIHLDWDTECLGTVPDFSQGPAFQGRIRWYSRPQRPVGDRRRTVYHGGCMYFRDVSTVDRAIEIHASTCRQYADEAATTKLADELCGSDDPERHREAGFDNPAFYDTGRNAVASNLLPAFREGPRVSSETAIPFVSQLIAGLLAERPRPPYQPSPKALLSTSPTVHE